MKPNIPVSALPTEMDPENRVTAVYSTQVLFPKLGPVGVQRIVRQYARVLRDYASAVELVGQATAFFERYGIKVEIPPPPPPSTKRDPRFRPILYANISQQSRFAEALAPFASPKASASALSALSKSQVQGSATSFSGTGGSLSRTPSGAASRAPGLTYDAAAVLPAHIARLLTQDPSADIDRAGRLVLEPLSPSLLNGAGKQVRDFVDSAGANAVLSSDLLDVSLEASARGFALAQILHGLAQPNVVIDELLRLGQVKSSGVWLSDDLHNTDDKVGLIAATLAGPNGSPLGERQETLSPLIDRAVDLLKRLRTPEGLLFERLRTDTAVHKQVNGFVIGLVDDIGIDGNNVPLGDEVVMTGSREWAFKRSERLNLKVGTPTLRGPFHAEAVTPNSELTVSESSLTEAARFTESGSGRSESRTNESSTFNASTFRQSLSTLSEDGINSDGAFSQNSTLFDTLRERRREAIERTLVQISSNNEQRSGSMERTVTSVARSYTTRGKDDRFATTELAFQVAAPVEAEVLLEGVGLVWCPRMISPFMYLHGLIVDFERQSEAEYLVQNYVLDPVRPLEVYEQSSFTHEIAIKGDTSYQAKDFSFTIPAGQIGWELDPTATTVAFRNGVFDDYDIWDRPNWDDLEVWNAWIQSIAVNGNSVSGRAVLETTDPEYLNKGFLTFTIVMRQLTLESRAALANFDHENKEAAAQRLAVAVRARQFGRLRRDELIEQYENNTSLQDEAFGRLIRQVFVAGSPEHASYFREILHSCIEWGEAKMRFEPGDVSSLPFPHLPPSHFMNTPGVRFTLPVLASAEEAFFAALEEGAGTFYQDAANAVRETVENYRVEVERLKRDDPSGLVLDRYSSQLILGRHLEAVLSEHPFADPVA